MRRLRILIVVFFVIVAIVFAVDYVHERMTSDFVAPEIHATSDALEASVSVTDEELLAGMSAVDNLDGNVTDTLVVVSKSKFISKGTLRVDYAAFDKNNNVGTYSRELTFTDYHSPHFRMRQPLRFISGSSSYDYLENITAEDCLDGNITQQIKITFGSKESVGDKLIEQPVNIQVTNSAGDTSVLQLTATFEEFSSYSRFTPALTEYVIYVPQGTHPDLRAYLRGVWTAGAVRSFADTTFDPSKDVVISERNVDFNTPGVYTATYSLFGSSKELGLVEYGTTKLIVIVEEEG